MDTLFYLNERSKANYLRIIYNENSAIELLDDSLRKECNSLKENIKLYFSNENTNMFISESQHLENFFNNLKINKPEIYNTFISVDVCSVNQLKAKLETSQSLIEYFVGDSILTMFCITRDTAIMYQSDISKDSLNKLTIDYKENIISVGFNENIDILANNLYKILLKPFEIYFKDYSLIIIPDGPLMEIPFEPLLTNLDLSEKIPYLIRRNPVSYHYSATLWLDTRERYLKKQQQSPKSTFLGFAPFGDFKSNSYSDKTMEGCAVNPLLEVTDDEIKTISNHCCPVKV